jgi:hypothetical protein
VARLAGKPVPADPLLLLGATLVLHAATLTGAGGVADRRPRDRWRGVPVLLWYRNRLRTAALLAQSRAK